MIKKTLFHLLLLSFLISCSSNLYKLKIEEAKSALHEEDYQKAIELIESALIEKPNDKDAEALLEMAKAKHTKVQLNNKIYSDLNNINVYFNDFHHIYTSDFSERIFTEESSKENVTFFKEGFERKAKLDNILTNIITLEVDSSLVKLKAALERAVKLEIEATEVGQVIFLLKDLDPTDRKADPINQFGNAMDTWTKNKEELQLLVPVIKNTLERKINEK